MLQIKACFFMGASVTQRQMTQRKKFVLNYILSLALFQVMTKNRIYPLVSDPTLSPVHDHEDRRQPYWFKQI